MRTILTRRPDTKVVMLTIHETEDLLLSAIRNGAVGYLVKSIASSKLIMSLRALERGEAALSRTMISSLVGELQRTSRHYEADQGHLRLLTARELEVLKLIGTGARNQEIAKRLVISENTVKVHVHNVIKKMNFRSRKEAVEFSIRNGISERILEPAEKIQ
jgi:DNA-binding NarL/FixJ family response regulator